MKDRRRINDKVLYKPGPAQTNESFDNSMYLRDTSSSIVNYYWS